MAFPCLFPNGVNGLHTARDPPITFTVIIFKHIYLMLIIAGLIIFHIMVSKFTSDYVIVYSLQCEQDHHHHWVAQGVSLLVN